MKFPLAALYQTTQHFGVHSLQIVYQMVKFSSQRTILALFACWPVKQTLSRYWCKSTPSVWSMGINDQCKHWKKHETSGNLNNVLHLRSNTVEHKNPKRNRRHVIRAYRPTISRRPCGSWAGGYQTAGDWSCDVSLQSHLNIKHSYTSTLWVRPPATSLRMCAPPSRRLRPALLLF